MPRSGLQLPVYTQRDKILKGLEESQVIVVESPTGSGKTTQLPIILYEAGYAQSGVIGVTQPRRIAAVSVSEFIARQLVVPIASTVGYKMRFYDETSPATRIKVLTDGMLLQEMKLDPMLSQYSVIMVDEAHERSLNIDFILGLLKEILKQRSELKVIISSATINPKTFSRYFDNCPIIHIDAQMYPVKVSYCPPERSEEEALYDAVVKAAEEHIKEGRSGDILVFFSGEKQISDCLERLDQSSFSSRMHLIPLFGRLSKELQDRVFIPAPEGRTKIVVSTNIAETSITIDGITMVIDSGLAKLNYYNPATFTSSLIEKPISKASARQRMGRAGRTAPGICLRLYTKRDLEMREQYTSEEIIRTDLSEVLLRMTELGIRDYKGFDYLTRPSDSAVDSAVRTLLMLSAIDEHHRLTDIGRNMAMFPLSPRHGRIIIEALMKYPQVLEETITAASFLSARSPFVLTPGKEIESRHAHHRFYHPMGDFVSYLQLYGSYRALQGKKQREQFCTESHLDMQVMDEILYISDQLTEILSEKQIPVLSGGSHHNYLCCIASGMVQFVCVRAGSRETYRSVTAERIKIHPGSVLFGVSPEFIVAGEIMKTSRMYARVVSPLKAQWLDDILPGLKDMLKKSGQRKIKQEKSDSSSGASVMLWGRQFRMVPFRGKKKLVELPLEELRRIKPDYTRQAKKLRGKIVHQGLEIHPGEKVNSLVRIYPHLHPEQGIYEGVPGNTYVLPDHTEKLMDSTYMLLQLCRIRKKKNLLGFIALESDGKHRYWFQVKRTLLSALDSTLFSLERIADEHIEQAGQSPAQQFSQVYRRASDLFDQL